MVYIWILLKKRLELFIIEGFLLVKRHIQFYDIDVGEMLLHVMPETNFTVVLLLTCHLPVLCQFHQHDVLLFMSNQHQHFCCKIAAAERVLSIKRKRMQIRQIGV